MGDRTVETAEPREQGVSDSFVFTLAQDELSVEALFGWRGPRRLLWAACTRIVGVAGSCHRPDHAPLADSSSNRYLDVR